MSFFHPRCMAFAEITIRLAILFSGMSASANQPSPRSESGAPVMRSSKSPWLMSPAVLTDVPELSPALTPLITKPLVPFRSDHSSWGARFA